MSFIVILVLKRTLTWMRRSRIVNKCLPIDDFTCIHKCIGIYIVFLALMHTTAHVVNQYYKSSDYFESHQTYNQDTEKDDDDKKTHEFKKKNYTEVDDESKTCDDSAYLRFVDRVFTNICKGDPIGITMPTGWASFAIMFFINIFTLPSIRRGKCFELFLYTHRLYAIVYIALIMHCSNFWKWFVFPAFLVLVEVVRGCVVSHSSKYGSTFIRDVRLLPSDVIQLVIMRPEKFKFKAGDYVRICIPTISKTESHPFTISSTPDTKDEISLHIRSNGDWTSKLLAYFRLYAEDIEKPSIISTSDSCCCFGNDEETTFSDVVLRQVAEWVSTVETKSTENKRRTWMSMSDELDLNSIQPNIPEFGEEAFGSRESCLSNIDVKKGSRPLPRMISTKVVYSLLESKEISNVFVDIKLDGPYGTASRNIFNTKHAVLVGSGIGVTPFASILQSLWKNHINLTKPCVHCNHQNLHVVGIKKLKKIDFIWINREYESFEWFMDLLAELEIQQDSAKQRFIDIQLYTTAKDIENTKAMKGFSEMLKKTTEPKLRSKIQEMLDRIKKGRPKFDKILQEITENTKHQDVEVFFCGNKNIGETLKYECLKKKIKFSQENF